MIKSGVSYFRKGLKIKGMTEHSGRGFYMMDFDCTIPELSKKIDAFIELNKEKCVVESDIVKVVIKLNPELCEKRYYNTLKFSPTSPWPLVVIM